MPKHSVPSSSPPSSWALAIPRVLESVFEYLYNEDFNQDLFACRLVCHSWAKEAGRVIGKRLDRKVSSLDQLETLRKIQKCSDICIPLKTLNIQIPASFDISKSSSQSYSTVTWLGLGCCPSLVPHFLVNIFPNLESLYLYKQHLGVRDNELAASPAVIWEKGTLPRLRNLGLHDYFGGARESLMDRLLEKAENLESIDVTYAKPSLAATFIAKVCSSSLTHLRISQTYSISEIFFTDLNNHPIIFSLETIDLEDIDIDTVSKSDIKLLLTRFSSTLGQLLLGFSKTFEMNFPLGVPMKKLHTLRLVNFRGSMEWRNLPQLKELVLHRSSIEGIAASISSTPACCHLEALNIMWPTDEGDKFVLFFREIAEYVGPQLESLELYCPSWESLLPVVFTYLTQLNRLSVWGNSDFLEFTDKDLCGTDSLSFRPPRKRSRGGSLNEAYQRRIASAKKSNHVRGPNITNLKDLQFLSIWGRFSEVAILHGIVHCEKLRELSLHFPYEGVSRDTIVHLLVNSGLQHLTTVKLNGERINHLSFAP